MPFHEGAYYPYGSDTQGTPSSAGIPSLLNSPLSPAPAMTPSSGAPPAVLPFKFRLRRESVDWRRINAVDVDMVVSQLDLDILQENISTVTFCSLEGERCPRCQSPVDPALVKLLRLAQLSLEWLLHCQEFLTLNLRAAEERLAAADREQRTLLGQLKKQEEKEKALAAELKQRKKVIRSQQSLLVPQIISSQKCPHCEKSFLNSTFLQNHLQRRHPEEYDLQLRSDTEQKSVIDSLKSEINSLKEQIVQQQQTFEAKRIQEKEEQSQKDLLRELDRFRAEAIAHTDRKIEDTRDGIRREMEVFYNRNIQALNEVNQNQPLRQEKTISPAPSQPERDVDVYKEMQIQAIQKLEQQMKKQDRKSESRLQEMKALHESEKNQLLDELSRMQLSLSEYQESSQKLQQEVGEMGRRLQKKEHTIRAQREQIKTISSNPPTKVVEVPVLVNAPAPEPKPKKVVLEEPVSALKLDPIQELSEEEKDSNSMSEKRPAERKSEPAPEKKPRVSSAVLKRNPNIKKELEQAVLRQLESLGVKPDQSRLKNNELHSILKKWQTKRDSTTRRIPDFLRHRKEIVSMMGQRVGEQKPASNPAAEGKSRRPAQVLQIRPRSSSLPSRASQVTAASSAVRQFQTPQPAPRSRSTPQPKTSTPNTKTSLKDHTVKTPPFSSDEESDSAMEEEEPVKHLWSKSPQPRLNPSTVAQTRAGKTSPAKQVSGGGATKTAITKVKSDEEDEEWSEVSELQEIDPRQLHNYKDQNGNVERRNKGKENKINDLARKVEKQFSERVLKKPAGGVSILPGGKDEVQELTYTDVDESSEWCASSEEDKLEALKPGALKKSLESPSTSVWGTSTGKAPRSGLTDAGTGSTLKSSLFSLSDFSDSEDFGKKQS